MSEFSTAPIVTHDGLRLAVEDHIPPGARAHVLIAHGFGEHKGRYGHVVAALTAADYACHLFDLRGHGSSEGRRGDVPRFENFRDDLDRVVGHVRRVAGRPVGLVVLGHSLGGLIALDHVIRRPGAFAAVVVTSPFIGPAIAVSRLERAVGNVLSRVAPRLRLDARIESRWLSHDPAVADAYARDARVLRRLTLRLWHEIEIAQRQVRARAAEIEQPALFLVGGDDHVVDTAPTYEVFRRLGSADKRLLTYAGYFHEILNEVGKGIVLGDLRHWLDEHFAP